MPHMSAGERALHFVARPLVNFFYRVHALGLENLPEGGFLLLPNHITWVDALVLQLACPRPIRYIIDQEFYHKPFLKPFLRTVGCIPIDSHKARSAIRAATEQIAAGEIVCLFPEGQLTRSGTLLRLHRGYELIAQHANAKVVPVWLDRLWGSIFSFQGGRFFTKWPQVVPYRVMVAFGKPLSAESADIATVREELLKIGEFCYSQRPTLRGHLARACLRGLKRNPFRIAITDGFDKTTLSRGKLLGVAVALSRRLRKTCPERRIGIVLPPGKGGVVANLAILLANKIPVNLNFTSARDSIESAKEQAGLSTIITAQMLAKRLEDFPWTPQVIYLEELLPKMKGAILAWWFLGVVVPGGVLARVFSLPRTSDRTQAVSLFTR